MLTVTTLASGSSGNCSLVSCGSTHILLDAGISAKRITCGLKALGVAPEELSAILITHEHSDHISGLQVLTKKLRVPIVASPATCRQLCYRIPFLEDLVREQERGGELELGALDVRSFATPHDAAGSVGYVLHGDGCCMALCTDLGYVTAEVEEAVRGCDLLICESNHDEEWVKSGPYPYHLKQRILGDYGHLSNEAGAELAAMAVEKGTRAVLLAHLSSENNTPAHAREVAVRRLRAMGADPEHDLRLAVPPRSVVGATYCMEQGMDIRVKEAAVC